MAVVVKKFTVVANGKKFGPGETISGLNKSEEKRLVDEGYCAFVDAPAKEKAPSDSGGNPPAGDQTGASNPAEGDGPNTSLPGAK